MKINVTKPTHHYAAGEHEVSEERGNYLIKMGVAEMAKEKQEHKMIEPQMENKLSPIKPKNKRKKK